MKNGENVMTQYNVKLATFEGPLDLLLHLINKAEVDIYDIPMAKITDQYLNYIHTMQSLELDVASEYLVMAATLLVIKSKMLLPTYGEVELFDEPNEILEEEDPREELIQRLIEYRKYKKAAEMLKEQEKDRELIFSKTPSDLSEYIDEVKQGPQQINASIYDILDAFQQLFKRKNIKLPQQTKIQRDDIPLEIRMTEIMETLNQNNRKMSFFELFEYDERSQLIVTFLALLELMKAKKIVCEQEANYADLMVWSWEGDDFVGSN